MSVGVEVPWRETGHRGFHIGPTAMERAEPRTGGSYVDKARSPPPPPPCVPAARYLSRPAASGWAFGEADLPHEWLRARAVRRRETARGCIDSINAQRRVVPCGGGSAPRGSLVAGRVRRGFESASAPRPFPRP